MNIEYEAALEAEFSATVTLDDINKTMAEIVDNKIKCASSSDPPSTTASHTPCPHPTSSRRG